MDEIAYHPIRLSPHASLFLPYSDHELLLYQNRAANPLRLSAPPLPNHSSALPPPSTHNPSAYQRSPPIYSTPSPLIISFSEHSRPANQNLPNKLDSSLKRSLVDHPDHDDDISDPPQPSHSSLESNTPRNASDQPNKRTRYSNDHDLDRPHPSVSQAVANHYNARPNLTKDARTESPIFGLRKFNNWIKSVLIGKFAAAESAMMVNLMNSKRRMAAQGGERLLKGTKVLELGCGKGGDLAKWQNGGVRELYGFDIAQVSIEQAQMRYQDGGKKRFFAKFTTLDCFSVPISSVLSAKELSRPFDAVSLQFCMHYAFESESKVRVMLDNVSRFLVSGGVFIGTIPDPDQLLKRLAEFEGQPEARWGNSVYQIDVPDHDDKLALRPVYGFQYNFYLQDAVEDVPEYIVFWEPFERLAGEYGLELVYKQGFHEIYERERFVDVNRQLLRRMNVVDGNGKCSMSADQWEASGQLYSLVLHGCGGASHVILVSHASPRYSSFKFLLLSGIIGLYLAFAFVKR